TAHVVDLATCRNTVSRAAPRGRIVLQPDGHVRVQSPAAGLVSRDGRFVTVVRATGKQKTLRDTIRVTDRRTGRSWPSFSAGVWSPSVCCLDSPGPIVLLGWSGDARRIFFAIDPDSSASIAADGLILQVVSRTGGSPHRLGVMLPYEDYLGWCGG